ncbi:protein of unknown function [Clostridium beijerinckii]|nr:protein of unknown function [Clostridium beijerinckii]
MKRGRSTIRNLLSATRKPGEKVLIYEKREKHNYKHRLDINLKNKNPKHKFRESHA